jgi:mannan endo-1,6-alpha-mannosidase
MWGALLDYRFHTGDTAHDDTVMQAMTWQAAPTKDFMDVNWTLSLGNDDQAFWAFAALIAAETGFTNPPNNSGIDWVALAQAVFNEQTSPSRRVYGGNCDGGLRWQSFRINGWDYINTIASACYLNVAARLARYSNNDTYVDVANSTWNFLTRLKYIDDAGNVYDGAHTGADCTDINPVQFSYNPAILIQGCAFLYNHVSYTDPCS